MRRQSCGAVGRQHSQVWRLCGGIVIAVLLVIVLISCAVGSGGSARPSLGAAPPRASVASPTQTPTPPPTATPTPTATPKPPGLDGQQPRILAALGHPDQAILVSLDHQTLYVYQHGRLVAWSYVTAGRPELQTPRGYFQVTARLRSITFYSKWPPGSPFYYPPVHVNYALRFLGTDFFLHDYSPRHYYGPGTNVWHHNPDGTWETGSHGCVEVPLWTMQWLFTWTPVGTPVVIY